MTQVFSLREAADRLGCGLSTTYGLVKSGQLKARKLLNRTVVTNDELERFIAELPEAEVGNGPRAGKEREYSVHRGKGRRNRKVAA